MEVLTPIHHERKSVNILFKNKQLNTSALKVGSQKEHTLLLPDYRISLG
jgi:hypothetical protein